MLVPAIVYKDEIERRFAKHLYDDDMFYYQGYAHGHGMPEIKAKDNYYQWAIVGFPKTHKTYKTGLIVDELPVVKGYFAYEILPDVDTVCNFGLYSFDKGNPLIGHDVFKKMESLVLNHHRVEWRCVSGNKALRGYVRFMEYIHKKHERYVYKHRLMSVTKDIYGNYRDEHIFEIVNKEV